VSKISRNDLIEYRKTQYIGSNTIVCLAGNFGEKEGIKKVKKYFSKIKIGKSREKPKVIEEQKKPEILFEKRETDQTHICLGVRGINLFDERKYVQEILALILGGMMSSRLFEKIREKLGIAYYIVADSFSDPDTGFLVCRAGLSNEKLERGISEILKEFRKVKREGVSKSELKKAKDCLKGKMNILLESSDAKASFFATQEILEKRILTPEQIFKKIDRVSQNDILKLAREIFRPEKLNLSLIGPKGVKKEILKI
jgi:predicted Zn-dependent peptidase